MIGLISRIIGYNLFKIFGFPKILPVFLTLSVNDWCNSRCKTCNIWKNDPKEKIKEELTVDEYEKIFENYGKTYWITITGGEPFLRKDLVQIIKTVYKNTNPEFLTIATNATLPKKIVFDVKKILRSCKKLNLIVNISLDGIGSKHDEIRGLKGNFNKVIKTYNLLKKLKSTRLTVGINTVVSKFNVNDFFKINEYVENILKANSFIIEIAERRDRLSNKDCNITPKYSEYSKILNFLIRKENRSLGKPKILSRLRKEYYRFLLARKNIPVFEGIASAYIMSNGEIWISDSKKIVIGEIRKASYNFRNLWFSKSARQFRLKMDKNYRSMLANSFYVNFVCNPLIVTIIHRCQKFV